MFIKLFYLLVKFSGGRGSLRGKISRKANSACACYTGRLFQLLSLHCDVEAVTEWAQVCKQVNIGAVDVEQAESNEIINLKRL